MALRAICPQALWTFMNYSTLRAIFWLLLKTTDWERLLRTYLKLEAFIEK